MPEQKRRIGRPRLYDNPEDLERAINEYLETTEEPTMSGLQVHVGMSKQSWSDSRHTLPLPWQNRKSELAGVSVEIRSPAISRLVPILLTSAQLWWGQAF